MSTINTNGIDVNYPVPGQNNNSQGFRNNFTAIRQNLNIAGNEITDLQNKVVLKTALANSVLNNDMANTLISNASTLQFRATTYNLGNALTGTVTVDCSLGDVQYGNVSGNVVLNFGSWAPVDTQSTIQLQIGRANTEVNYTITFPEEVIFTDDNHGITLLENFNSVGNVPSITFPHNVTQVNLKLTSTDCGNSIFVEPLNRPYQTTQIQQRSPSPTGFLGDVAGTVAVDTEYLYVCTGDYDANIISGNATATSNSFGTLSGVTITGTGGQFSCSSTILVTGMQILVSGSLSGTGSITGYSNPSIYYITTTDGASTFTLVDFSGNAIVTSPGTTAGLTFTITNVITFDTNVQSAGVTANMPVVFDTMFIDGNSVTNFGNINAGQFYYVKTVSGANITISDTRSGGTAGSTLALTTVTANVGNTYMDATFYDGTDIWKRVSLSSW